MLRIAICDDEMESRDALRVQLEKKLIEDTEEIVYEFSSGTNAASWLASHPGEIDLLFLDVEMKGLSGMEAAEKIRTFDSPAGWSCMSWRTCSPFPGNVSDAFCCFWAVLRSAP